MKYYEKSAELLAIHDIIDYHRKCKDILIEADKKDYEYLFLNDELRRESRILNQKIGLHRVNKNWTNK